MIPVQTSCGCGGSSGPKLIFSCSGAADVGELADKVARKLTKERTGMMFCLAGIGGRVSGIMKSTEAASTILAIDGCALDCTKKTLEEAGFKRFTHLRITDLGFEKGKTEVDAKSMAKVTEKAKSCL
jgi:uncharacterized metal-binding protein